MALSTRTRGWLRAASEDALAQLRHELALLGERLTDSRREAAESEARLTDQIAQARAETDIMRQELRTLADRVEEQAHRDEARIEQLEALRRRCDDESRIEEEIRLKIAGLVEQWRWESEDLRKALAALAERTRLPA
jgi:hypothetical protein